MRTEGCVLGQDRIPKSVAAGTPLVAYFPMEIGLNPGMPTHAGGLGVLAGDTVMERPGELRHSWGRTLCGSSLKRRKR